jgi:hypothetical protein
MCQICLVTDEETYVWSDGECVLCESGQAGVMYGLLVAVLIMLVLVAYFIMRNKEKAEEIGRVLHVKWERFNRQILTKYKIVVKLLQTLAKITTLYPFTLPAVFVSVFSKISIVDLDVNVLPFNCVVSSTNFHHKLLLMTLVPLGFVAYVGIVYLYQRHRIVGSTGDAVDECTDYDIGVKRANASRSGQEAIMQVCEHDRVESKCNQCIEKRDLDKLEADCLYVVLVFLYTIFSLVSTTIIQTFHYDDRLENGELYLIADYTITQSDPIHRNYVVYAWFMAVVYCLGIPGASFWLLKRNQEPIKELQTCMSKILEKEKEKKKMLVEREILHEKSVIALENQSTQEPLETSIKASMS